MPFHQSVRPQGRTPSRRQSVKSIGQAHRSTKPSETCSPSIANLSTPPVRRPPLSCQRRIGSLSHGGYPFRFEVRCDDIDVELRNWQPPFWLHALLWGPLTVLVCVGPLRPLKGALIGLQYRFQAAEGRPVRPRPE